MEHVAIFGGSFDPIHVGHLIMARDAAEAFRLDRILFVPAARPPHKRGRAMVEPEHRLAMVRRALDGAAGWEASDLELVRGGVSYSIDTARAVRARYPEAALHFIIGGDTLPELHTWREIDALLGLCRMITLVRPGFDAEALRRADLRLAPEQVEALLGGVVEGHLIGVSSTEVRMRVARGASIRYLVPDPVADYISENGLYRS